jgi:hypothetical protein
MFRTTHIFRSSVVAVAVAALLTAPAAFAGGTSQYGAHDAWYAYATSHSAAPAQLPDPWLRYAVALTSREMSAQPTGLSFTTDTLGGNGQPQQTPVVHFVTDTMAPGGGNTVVSTSPGFDWTDAGIGAGAALGGLLLASVAGVAVMRRRGRLAF